MVVKPFTPDFEAIRLDVLDEYQATIPQEKAWRNERH